MATTKNQYDQILVKAANSVLLEIAHILHSYEDSFVVVGGLVPSLILRNTPEAHIGSIDVDIALKQTVPTSHYKTIQELLLNQGYKQEEDQPFTFSRSFQIDEQEIKVNVDFLADEYGGIGKSHRTQRVQDMRPRKARACYLAFEQPLLIKIMGILPEGGKDQVTVQVASIVPFLMMKAQALNGRMKEKDAYDIYFCLLYYPGGHEALIEAFTQFPHSKCVTEGLTIFKEKFDSPEHFGPVAVANFINETNLESRARLQRDVYERMNALLLGLGIL